MRKSEALLKEDIALIKYKIKSLEAQLDDIRHSDKRSKRERCSPKRGRQRDDDLFDAMEHPLF
jgi:hypothetical protein